MTSKVSCHVSEILPQLHEDEEEVIPGSKTPETPEEEKLLMMRSMFKNIMAQALNYQKKLAGLDAVKEAGLIACARTERIWFNANEPDEPKQLSRSSCNALCHL